MEITVTPTALAGVLLIDTHYFEDERGFFLESYHRARFAEHGLDVEFVQDNHSSSRRGVLRGIHWQDLRAPMGKLVRCTRGEIQDVVVDLRVGSPTFARWIDVDLTAANKRQLWVPPGFGHAFAVLSEEAEVQYKCTAYYAPDAEATLAWDDPELDIGWRVAEPQVSARDRAGMSLADYRGRPSFTYDP